VPFKGNGAEICDRAARIYPRPREDSPRRDRPPGRSAKPSPKSLPRGEGGFKIANTLAILKTDEVEMPLRQGRAFPLPKKVRYQIGQREGFLQRWRCFSFAGKC